MGHRFAVSFACGLNKLNTIIDILDGEVDRLIVKQEEDGPGAYAGDSSRLENSKPAAIVFAFMEKEKIYRPEDFRDVLESKGYSRSTASPSLSLLVRAGKVERRGKGRYQRPDPEEAI